MSLRDAVEAGLLAIPDVELRASRFGGKDAFYVGRREFAHFEPGDVLDLRLTRAGIRERREALKADPRAELRPSGGDWLELSFASAEDVAWVVELATAAVEQNRAAS